MKRKVLFFILAIGILFLAGCSRGERKITGDSIGGGLVEKIVVYRSSSCGCCSLYSSYVKNNGNIVDDVVLPDLAFIKTQYNIPASVESCHTSIIGKYFVVCAFTII